MISAEFQGEERANCERSAGKKTGARGEVVVIGRAH